MFAFTQVRLGVLYAGTCRTSRLVTPLSANTHVYLGTAASHKKYGGYNSSVHRHSAHSFSTIFRTRGPKSAEISKNRPFTTMASVPEGVLLGLGNPLLDITITEDESFLKKYGLEANNAIEADDSHLTMFDDIINHHKPTYIAGGANQNTIRVAQWMLQRKHATTFFGCVGDDKMGKEMRKKAEEVGVRVVYQIDKEEATGVCGAIICGENRSLVSHLGAAMHFKVEFLTQPENWCLVEKASCYYICGFPFTVSPESIVKIAQHASDENKTLVMNLSAPYLCKYYADSQYNIMSYIDILFGNETEAATFCKLKGLPTDDLKQMAWDVSRLEKKNGKKKRMVIFTQGRDPTIVAHDGIVEEHVVQAVDKSLIKDTNGCGDAFVGGFCLNMCRIKSCLNVLDVRDTPQGQLSSNGDALTHQNLTLNRGSEYIIVLTEYRVYSLTCKNCKMLVF